MLFASKRLHISNTLSAKRRGFFVGLCFFDLRKDPTGFNRSRNSAELERKIRDYRKMVGSH